MERINSLFTGIKSGHQIERYCESCHMIFMGWSDDTVTIKGKMPQQKLCPACQKIESDKLLPSVLEALNNMKNQ